MIAAPMSMSQAVTTTVTKPGSRPSVNGRRKPKNTFFGPYLLLQTIGEGEFAKVKLALHRETGEEVAIKLIKKESIDTEVKLSKIKREIAALKEVNFSYIVRLHDIIETERYIGIVIEYASGGELFDHILAHRQLKENDACRLFAQLIAGVSYLHASNIVHRDLKLENLLLDRNRNIKITDFGFANQFSGPGNDFMSTSCGSPCYAAPELVVSEGPYAGTAVDIWSCGVILYAMLAGFLPFDDDPSNPEGDNINQLYNYILTTPLVFPDNFSPLARSLLNRMLVPNPKDRATLEEIKAHDWMKPYASIFTEPNPGSAGPGSHAHANGVKGQALPDGSAGAKNTPAAPDVQAKKSKRHTIQVEYSTLPSQIVDDSQHNEDAMPEAPSAEMIAQARAAAQAALMGEKPPAAASYAPGSGASVVSTKALSKSIDESDGAVPDVVSSTTVGDRAVPKSTDAEQRPAQQRPRPMSMFASTEMHPDIPDETIMPPAISTIMDMGSHGGLSSASSIDASIRLNGVEVPRSRVRPVTLGADQFVVNKKKTGSVSSQTSHRSRSNSEAQRRPSIRSNNTGTLLGHTNGRDGGNRRGRMPEIPPILPVNSTTGEELGIGVGAGIASHVPRHVEDVLFPDSPTPQSPRLQTGGAASRVKSWFNRRTSRWGTSGMGVDQPMSISSVLSADRREQPEILQHMRVHRGVIDPDALSELPPDVLFSHVLRTLDNLGFTVLKTEGLKIRVLRPRRQQPQQELEPLALASPGRGRTMSDAIDGDNSEFKPPAMDGPRRQSVPMVLSKAVQEREWSAASKRATIMNPAHFEIEAQKHGFSLAEKSPSRRSRGLGSALTSVRRFFGSGSLGSKRWFSSSATKAGPLSSSDSTAADSGEDENPKLSPSSRRGSTTNNVRAQGLGIAVSTGATDPAAHRRSLSESPYMNAKAIRDQVNGIGGGGLAVVPEEAEAHGSTPVMGGSGNDSSVPERQQPLVSSPFSHAASLGSVSGAAALNDNPFINPFQTPVVAPPYGTAQVDNGDEVQLAIEVCKIKNLNNFFIVHLSRRKGNVWAYKHLYHLIMENLALRSDDRRRYAPKAEV